MASILRNAAVASVSKGAQSSFYSTQSRDKPNPVFQKLDQEINLYVGYMKKRASPGYSKPTEESYSRPSNALFDLWNKYEHRLPVHYYQEKLLEMGDFLASIKEYNLALWQCYERYLEHFGDVNVEQITDVDTFKITYFPEGFDTADAGYTFRALMGKSICMYQVVKMTDPKLQNLETVGKCTQILSFLRLVTQVILPKESLCWLVYNGTIHIYSVSRHLMSLGHSAKVLEFLLWACMCMESSVPLMGKKYLTWRVTLYTAVCQSYFDCKCGNQAEAFSRRALQKINELSHLESESNSNKESPETEVYFRQATVKMAIMVYRRTVFETRKRPKGLLRPKTRANMKDFVALPWPRTLSEKLMSDMFEGSAAQLLCIIETLTDSNRRTLLTSTPAPDSEVEVLDVFAELFMAAQEIIAGGGGSTPQAQVNAARTQNVGAGSTQILGPISSAKSLIEMATNAENGTPLSAIVKIVKLAYCYEQWDVFDSMIDVVMAYVKELGDIKHIADEKALEILMAMDRLNPNRKHKRQPTDMQQYDGESLPPPPTAKSNRTSSGDDLVTLADVLVSIVNDVNLTHLNMDLDMVVDAVLLLWNRCKAVFQRYQTGSVDSARYLQRMENPEKWVYILENIHLVLGWCGISSVDPALTAEVVLRLAMVMEASAMLGTKSAGKRKGKTTVLGYSGKGDSDEELMSPMPPAAPKDIKLKQSRSFLSESEAGMSRDMSRLNSSGHNLYMSSILNKTAREQLIGAKEILELGLENVSFARQAVALSDGKSIADISWVKELNADLFAPVYASELGSLTDRESSDKKAADATVIWSTTKDLHVELINIHHRVSLKLAALGEAPSDKQKPFKRRSQSNASNASNASTKAQYVEKYEDLLKICNKNMLSKALLCTQKAIMSGNDGRPTKEQIALLKESVSLVQKAESEERNLYTQNIEENKTKSKSKVPPAPRLLSRTDTCMVFKPAEFTPPPDKKVAWYRIFGRSATGSNVKVRLNDYYLPGTGVEVPSFRCELRISGLTSNERYVFAVGAYTANGELIGGSVGETSKPILASHPLPVLMVWAYISQVAYQTGCYDIATEASSVLWRHFVAAPVIPEEETFSTTSGSDFNLTLHRLNRKILTLTSPVLLRQFLATIFISVDTAVKEDFLFCDKICDNGSLFTGQINRLLQCERMLVALELAGWLNEANWAMQAVVQCYGLLTPMIYFKIPSVPAIQVLERCHAVLQEIPAHLRQRRTEKTQDSLQHMTACLTYHITKVLRTWHQRTLANRINDAGHKLIDVDSDQAQKITDIKSELDEGEQEIEPGMMTLQSLKKKKGTTAKKQGVIIKDDEGTGNEELKALEAHMLKLSRQAQSEHELTGNEDPNILHAYIAYLPSKIAYKEVLKFKRRSRYLEFFVQVVQKCLSEGMAEQALEWCEDAIHWIHKRNEMIVGSKAMVMKQPGGVITIAGDDPKKFAAAMMEYSKDYQSPRNKGQKGAPTTAATANTKKKPKYKVLHCYPGMPAAEKQAQEEKELKALESLTLHFPDLWRGSKRRQRFRKVSNYELPWRCQLNIYQGLSHFGVFLMKLEMREKVLGNAANNMFRTSFLDQEWFTFETAGTLVVNWSGGPSKMVTRHNSPLKNYDTEDGTTSRMRRSAIESAAAAATGLPPPPMFPEPVEMPDTPRTYTSDDDEPNGKESVEAEIINTRSTLNALKKTFDFFKKAIVLAHRGGHWNLLQNACRALWNCAHTALLRAFTSGSHDSGLITSEALRSLVWSPFHTAADCLLDMMVQLQEDIENRSAKSKKQTQKEPFVWMNDVSTEKGGASLRFESPLDNNTYLDTRWLKRIVLRTMEVLFYENKWEKLVDLGLRFNALTCDRYIEQVTPLLVQAQRKINQNLETAGGGVPLPQPHLDRATEQCGGSISSKQYLKLQLVLELKAEELPAVELGAHIDPEGHNVYKGFADAIKRVCVPIDVKSSLNTLREALEKTHYTSRALQHSRRLLVLYLAGRQDGSDALSEGDISREVSKVDFRKTTARPQSPMPPNLSKEEFNHMDDVQTTPVPKGQLGVVLSSYDKTIEMLLARNQKGLAAQAMHELGNLHYHDGNSRAAYNWWAESLDIILNIKDALSNWRKTLTSQDISSQLLDCCGLWGCILGGVLTSNIAQYIITSDLGMRMECCFLSGYFFKALFRSSLPHPTSDRDYALYDIGEGCEVTNLVPGIDLLAERFRSDGRTLVAALRWVTEELARGRHNLFVLPLLTLYQYFTTFVCRDLQRTVDGRILKVRILTNLGLFTEAFIILQRLLHGERLPHTADSNFRQVESKMSSVKFDTSKPLTEACNLKVLESAVDKRLSSNLGSLYGPHMTCMLSITQAHAMIAVAETLPVLPEMSEIGGRDSVNRPRTMSTASKNHPKNRPNVLKSNDSKNQDGGNSEALIDESEVESDGSRTSKCFTARKDNKVITSRFIKGTLLKTAEQILSTVSETLLETPDENEGPEGLAAAELELVVICKLELANIARQRHHAAMATRVVLSAMKFLKFAKIFHDRHKGPNRQPRPSSMKHATSMKTAFSPAKITEPMNSQFQYQNFQSRSRLDARLWLDCRFALVKSMMSQIKGMGHIKGPVSKVIVELADCRQYIGEGVMEAESCGDVEMQAEFLFQGALLNIMEGRSLEETMEILTEVGELLQNVNSLSTPGQLLLTINDIQLTDMMAASSTKVKDITEKTLARYVECQTQLLYQIQDMGDKIIHYYPEGERLEFSGVSTPMTNIYLPHILVLAQLKLRIGHAMARNTAKVAKVKTEDEMLELWSAALGVLTTSLEMSQVITNRQANLEAEILFNIGKVQRQLFLLGKFYHRAVAETLLEAINISFHSDHDLGLIRQSYLEIALLYIVSSGVATTREGSLFFDSGAESGDEKMDEKVDEKGEEKGEERETSVVETPKKKKRSSSTKKWMSKKDKEKSKIQAELSENDKERRAAWVAIRCAAYTGQAQRLRMLLTGDVNVTSKPVTKQAVDSIPEFTILDLLSHYCLGEKRKIYKNKIEEDMAPLVESLEVKVIETYEDQIEKCRKEAADISWIHLLGYQSLLQRLCSTATLPASSEQPKGSGGGDDEFVADLGFISHVNLDTNLNQDVVRTTLFSGQWALRVAHMHLFFTDNLGVYAAECTAMFPPDVLYLETDKAVSPLDIVCLRYLGNLASMTDSDPEAVTPLASPPGVMTDVHKPTDKDILQPPNAELSLQWYMSSLDEPVIGGRVSVNPADSFIILLYAVSKKPEKGVALPASSLQCGMGWVSAMQLIDLHDRLAVLTQRGEISLVEKSSPKKEKEKEPVKSTKKQARIKALSPKIKKDEQLEALLRQCLSDAQSLFGVTVQGSVDQEQPGESEIPFEVSKANVQHFEKVFDPSFGFTLKERSMLAWFLQLFPQTAPQITRQPSVQK